MQTSLGDEVRVLIAAEDPLARTALSMLMAEEEHCQIVGQIDIINGLDEALEAFRPDVVLWDTGWEPDIGRIEEVLIAGEEWPLLLLLPDDGHLAAVWHAGARAVIRRDASPPALSAALVAVSQGLAVLEPEFAEALSSMPLQPPNLAEELTPRETEVLQLVAEGMSNRAIAQRLGISPHTVKFHVNSLMGKLEAQSRTEAVVIATRLGYILL